MWSAEAEISRSIDDTERRRWSLSAETQKLRFSKKGRELRLRTPHRLPLAFDCYDL